MTREKPSAASQALTAATDVLTARCERMLALASDPRERLCDCFASDETRKMIGDFFAFAQAIGACTDVSDFRQARPAVERLRARVWEIDSVLLARTAEEPQIMSAIISCELTVLRLLEQADPTVQILANLGLKFRREAETLLMAGFLELRRQLERHELGESRPRGIGTWLNEGLETLVSKCIRTALREPLQQSIAAQKNILSHTSRKLIKAFSTPEVSTVTVEGPRTEGCRRQVLSVVSFLADPRNPQSIRNACHRTFRAVKGGYANADCMYVWCHRNETLVWRWVENARLV